MYERINKKLNSQFSKYEIEKMIFKIINETEKIHFQKKGKNFYITSRKHNIRITINSNTHRVITVDRLIYR